MSAAPARSFTRLAVAIIIAALVISASALSYASFESTVTQTVTVGNDTMPNQPCSTEIYPTLTAGPADGNVPVLLMSPSTTGYVCITYQTAWQGNPSRFSSSWGSSSSDPYLVNGTFPLLPFLVVTYEGCGDPTASTTSTATVTRTESTTTTLTATATGGSSCMQIIYHSFDVGAVPSSITPTGTMDYFTVVYSVTAPSNSTGFYDSSAPWTGCLGMPMAVGYSASRVNGSDFTPQPVVECPAQPYSPVAEYVTGMSVTYVNLLSP